MRPATLLLTALVALLLLGTAALAGCGTDEGAAEGEAHTAPNGDEYNDADVDFATEMIRHHAQALAMVDLTLGRDLDPAVQQIVERIRTTQVAEIQTMTTWLTDWGRPVPETVRDHANAHGDGSAGHHGPGMMSEEQMSRLEAARGAAFQELWLELMTEHHQGAIEMAGTEQEQGRFAPAFELATSITESQRAEIDRMADLRG
jgi:uncharacterized protein (DUF305 family)